MRESIRPGFFTADQVKRVKITMGINAVDNLLEGGIEAGLTHLFYGSRGLHNDFLRFAVRAQMSKKTGGTGAPIIIIDSANMVKIERITEICYELDLEPEEVMDRIYITRAFNSSQTYDIIMNQLNSFFVRVPARVLLVTGLPNLYIEEKLTGEGLQQISHMAANIMKFTLQRDLFTLISAPISPRSKITPAGGRSLASNCQVHIRVEESKSYVRYILAKHPQYPVRNVTRTKPTITRGTLPLSHFLGGESEKRDY
jgi:hypothetical protein